MKKRYSIDMVMGTYEAGAEAVTVSTDLLTAMCSNGVTDAWVTGFENDWIALYGNKRIYVPD